MRLRSDIYWAARRWQKAAEQIELLLRRPLEELRAAHRRRALRHPARRRRLCAGRGQDRHRRACARSTPAKMADGPGPPRLRRGHRRARHQQRRVPRGGARRRLGRYARGLPARPAGALSGDARRCSSGKATQPAGAGAERRRRPIRRRPARSCAGARAGCRRAERRALQPTRMRRGEAARLPHWSG